MISRWKIEESPAAKDPGRRVLWAKGTQADVQGLIRRFGAVCGRPKKEKGDPEYNFSLFLHHLTPDSLKAIEAELKGLAGEPAAASSAAPPAQPAPAPTPTPAPVAELPVLREPPEEPEKPGDFVNLFDELSVGKKAADVEAAAPEQGPVTMSLTPPAEQVRGKAAAGPAPAERPLLGALLPMDPAHSLENFMVGAFNRFAHAAATSVVGDPGGIHNPLFVSGPPGCGKSHLLHSIGLKLNEQFPQGPVLMTSGACLAQAVASGAQDGRLKEIMDFAQRSKALLIDDFHMTAVAEQNQEGLAQLLKLYLGGGKQLVLCSVYAPKLLGAMESSLDVRFSAGHAVEIKLPGGDKQAEIGRQALKRAGLEPDDTDDSFFSDKMRADFSMLESSIRRLCVLRSLKAASGQRADLRDSLAAVFPPDQQPFTASAEELRAALAREGALPEGSRPAAVLFPKGCEAHAEWAWRQLQVVSRLCGWQFPFFRALCKPYEIEPVFGVPFVAAEECRRSGVRAALVVGPPPGTDLAEHERDFRYALEHLLRDMAVGLGWVQCVRIKDPKTYTLAYLDMSPLSEAKP